MSEIRICSRCGLEKPTSEFPRANGNGWRRDCKTCYNFSNREKWRRNHPEALILNTESKPAAPTIDVQSAILKEKNDNFFAEHYRDGLKRCSSCKEYKSVCEYYADKTTRDGFMAQCQGCYGRSEKERIIHLSKPWLRTFSNARSRAKKLGIPFSLTKENVQLLYSLSDGICPVLQIPMMIGGDLQSVPSIDRIRPEFGYVTGNVRLISFRANSLKSNATLYELRLVCQDLESIGI
jgi:hypothetical protein